MDTYGSESIGKIIIQKVDTLPLFNEYDIGRLICTTDGDTIRFYVGGQNSWMGIAGKNIIKKDSIDFGFEENQINSTSIPVKNIKLYFDSNYTVEDILNGLADGTKILDEVLKNRHFSNNSIESTKLKIGTTDDTYIGAQSIPYYSNKDKTNITIADDLDYIHNNYSIVTKTTIKIEDYDYNIVDNTYVYSIYFYNPYTENPPICQCYDPENNYIVCTPLKMSYDLDKKLFYIEVDHRFELVVILIG